MTKDLAEWIVKAIETVKSDVADKLEKDKRKIKNCKRHRANKRIAKLADSFYFAAIEVYLDKPSLKMVVGQRIYHIIYFRNGFVPFNIVNGGWLVPDNEFIITEKDTNYLENPPSFYDWYKMFHAGLSKENS